MPTEKTLRVHASLVDRMAETVGVDLQEQTLRGAISDQDIDNAVLKCTGCTQPKACSHWLSVQSAPVETPPAYCRNTALFEALRP